MGIVCERNKEVKGRKINAKGEKEWGVGGGEKERERNSLTR